MGSRASEPADAETDRGEGTYRGFVLQPTYRIEKGRAVVHLYGRLEDGATFLVRDDGWRPTFYLRARDAERARALGVGTILPSRRLTYTSEEPVVRVEVQTPPDAPARRDRLHQAGIATFEADVRFVIRFLIRHGLRGGVEISGPWRAGQGVDRVFSNPRLASCRWDFSPNVLSLDVETDPAATRLLSVALVGCGVDEVLLWCPKALSCPPGAIPARTQRDLLAGLAQRIREIDPDVLTGWNVVDFDLRVIERLARERQVPLELGRGPGALRLRQARGARGLEATIPGRLVLDGIDLVRGAFIPLEEHSLDFVANHVLGRGKVSLGGPASADRAGQILASFKQDRERFVAYNREDAQLVLEILDRLELLPLAVERSYLTGLSLDRVAGSIAAFDFLYLGELGRRGLVAPSVGGPDAALPEAAGGGHVLTPAPGLYQNVLVFDFLSLYPSLIRTFQIDPLGWVRDPGPDENLIVAPNGAAFRRTGGILPGLLDELFAARRAAKDAGNEVASRAIKILMNSFYGVLGTPACRFHDPALANAITSFGRELLLWSKARLESYGHRVLYGDTDSLFVQAGVADPAAATALGAQLVERLGRDLDLFVGERWGVESRLTLEFETLYLRLLLPAMRHSAAGARKRYAGLVEEKGQKKVVFTGLEAVRRDWTELARLVQRELYTRLFLDQPVETYLRQVVEELRQGRHDDSLVYRKALRKPLASYTATSPPHVVAARRMEDRPGRLIRYVVTREGPQPAAEAHAALDYEHYVDKQILPIAEPVLNLLGLEFRKVIGDERQLALF